MFQTKLDEWDGLPWFEFPDPYLGHPAERVYMVNCRSAWEIVSEVIVLNGGA